MTDNRFPINIDLSAYLATKGVDVPYATITICSTFWEDGGREQGKPAYEMPELVWYSFGLNETDNKEMFAAMLANFNSNLPISGPQIGVMERFSPKLWYYNQITQAEQEHMLPHRYPYNIGSKAHG